MADSRHGGGAANQSGVNVGEPRSSHTGHNLLLNFECYRYIYLSRYAKSQKCVSGVVVCARGTPLYRDTARAEPRRAGAPAAPPRRPPAGARPPTRVARGVSVWCVLCSCHVCVVCVGSWVPVRAADRGSTSSLCSTCNLSCEKIVRHTPQQLRSERPVTA